MKYFYSIIVAVCTAIASASASDLTGSLEFVANPEMERWPANAMARAVLDLQFYQGRLFFGAGEVESNPGAPWVYSINPYDKSSAFEYAPGTEAIANFTISSWGDLVTPAQDPHEGDPNEAAVFSRSPDGVWSKFATVGGSTSTGSSTVKNNTHCWDMTEYDGRYFVSCYNILSSTNRFKSFQVCSPITNAYHKINFKAFRWQNSRKTYYQSYTSTLRRQMQLLRFDNELFAVGNTVIQPWYMNDTTGQCNMQEVYRYNKTTKRFDELTQNAKNVYPDLRTNDYQLVGHNVKYIVTNDCARVYARLWHTTPFKNRVLYVACYDTPPYSSKSAPYEDTIALTSYPLPLMGCSAVVDSNRRISATRISFGGDQTNYPWDYAVAGDAVYALTSRYVADGKKNHHIVWKSTDGVNFTEVFSFDFHQNFISIEYRDGYFYLGVGYKAATKGYSYDSTADESGAIYRVRLPQEPVRVVASAAEVSVAEGSSANVTFRLESRPSSNVTLRVGAPFGESRLTASPTTLEFTTSNWSTPQQVKVSLADDDELTGDGRGAIVCGVAGFDVARGEFCGPEVASASVVVNELDDECVPPPNGEIRTVADFYCAMLYPDGSYRMMADLDISDSIFTTIDEFSGTLDGNGHTLRGLGERAVCKTLTGAIANLTVDGGGMTLKCLDSGAFCNAVDGGAFSNCTLKGYVFAPSSQSTSFGAFAGEARYGSRFVGCTIASDCEIRQNQVNVNAGGFVGKFTSTVTKGVVGEFVDCTNDAPVFSCGNYNSSWGEGGFIGQFSGCNSGDIPEIRFVRCVNNGPLNLTGKTATQYTQYGGFVGKHVGSSNKSSSHLVFDRCLNTGSVSGLAGKGTLIGGFLGVGTSTPTVTFDGCVNRGELLAADADRVGGLVATFSGTCTIGTGLTVINSANYGAVNGKRAGGLVASVDGNASANYGSFRFLNSANYAEVTSSVDEAGEIAAVFTCGTVSGVKSAISNCWTKTASLCKTASRTDTFGGNYTAATAAATAAAALDAVAAKEDGYLGWTVGPTGNPELLFADASEEEPDDPPPPAHSHVWSSWSTNVAPTCVTAGQLVHSCVADGCSDPVATETQPIAALGHIVVVDPAVAPTESSTGLTEGSHCSRCGAILVAQQVVPKLIPGQTLYVATIGSDSASGAFDAPLLTISNAVARLGSVGGTVMVGPGVFTSVDPVRITAPVAIVGSGTGNGGTVLRNVAKYGNAHQNCRVLELSNAVCRVSNLIVENGYAGIYDGDNGGGGVMLWAGMVTNCVIRGCTAHQGSHAMPFGGGVYVHGADALLTHCVITNCAADFDAANWGSVCGSGIHVSGGRVSNTLVVDCHFGKASAVAERNVGGVLLTDGTAENCTVVNCWGSKAGGIYASPASKKTVRVVNCVAFGCEKRVKDSAGVVQVSSSNGDGTETCFDHCAFGVTASAFADYANGDYRPAAGGALVDTGMEIADAPAGDLNGDPRIVGVAIDIGCFEWQEGGVVELETPVLSGSSFGFSGTGKFSIAVENPVRGAYYTVFTTEDLRGTFVAESASVLCDGEALVLEMDASAPQKFAKVVVSASPFEAGATCP